jgi:hypothetical protein
METEDEDTRTHTFQPIGVAALRLVQKLQNQLREGRAAAKATARKSREEYAQEGTGPDDMRRETELKIVAAPATKTGVAPMSPACAAPVILRPQT